MKPKQIVVLGGGFAGLWAAAGAARKLAELNIGTEAVRVSLVNRDLFHSIRVRNYEDDLTPTRVPLCEVLAPIGVDLIVGDVEQIDVGRAEVGVGTTDGAMRLPYDRLVMALGSRVVRPSLPGLREFAFDVDTYAGATRLQAHLKDLVAPASGSQRADGDDRQDQLTVLVIGAGLTGIEVATELPARLKRLCESAGRTAAEVRVILADHSDHLGSTMGQYALPVIAEALQSLGVETRVGVKVVELSRDGARLANGEFIPARTIVWCAGLQAHPLTESFPVERDRWGRLPVDEFLRVAGVERVFAAGDVAAAVVDPGHMSVMSCQHSRPMGRFAGHNVVADLLGIEMLPFSIDWYVTVLDLGPWGALYTEGWDRRVVATGTNAKETKQTINCQRIYPARADRQAILTAAAPVTQRPPSYRA
jgi:NADH:ubiquinone reductase (H+-translocating)